MSGYHKLVGEVAIKALQALKDVTDAFDRGRVEYCLEGGTLLGIVREQRLLPWDDDVDLTIRADQAKEALVALETLKWRYKIRERHYFVDHGPLKKGELRLIRVISRKFFFWRGKVRMDIFVKQVMVKIITGLWGGKRNMSLKVCQRLIMKA